MSTRHEIFNFSSKKDKYWILKVYVAQFTPEFTTELKASISYAQIIYDIYYISYRAKLKQNNRFRAQISSTSSQDESDDEIQQLEGNNGTYKDWHQENQNFIPSILTAFPANFKAFSLLLELFSNQGVAFKDSDRPVKFYFWNQKKANNDLEIYEIKLLASHHVVEGLYKHFSEFGLVSHIYESYFFISLT